MNTHRIITILIVLMLLVIIGPFNESVIAASEDLTTYTENDPLNRLTNTSSTITVTNMQRGDNNTYQVVNYTDTYGFTASDFSISFEFRITSALGDNQRRTWGIFAGWSDNLGAAMYSKPVLWCGFYVSDSKKAYMMLGNWSVASEHTPWGNEISTQTNYWAYFNRTGTTLSYNVYTAESRTDANLLGTLTAPSVTTEPFDLFYVAQSFNYTLYHTRSCSWYSRWYNVTVTPAAPTNPVATYTPPDTLNLTWTKGTNANNTVLVMKTTGYPTSKSDGEIWYNGTDTWYENSSLDSDTIYYVSGWSELYWSGPNRYEISSSYTTFSYGNIVINCYDENTSDLINSWDSDNTWGVMISDKDGETTYENMAASNPTVISMGDIPFGLDTVFVFNATNYSQRIYYMDLTLGNSYALNAYLPPANRSEPYKITIDNEYGEPVVDVDVDILRYINDTTGWDNVSRLITDGAGEVLVNLIPDVLYKVRLNKTGYRTTIHDFPTSNILFVKTFRILFEEEEYINETDIKDIISFDVEIVTDNLIINFLCSDNNIVTTSIVIYSINNSTSARTAIAWDNRTGNNDFQVTQGITDGMCYEVTITMVHSIFGTIYDFRVVCDRTTTTTKTRFDTLFDLNFTYNPFGWSNLFGFFVLLGTMFSFGEQHVGLSMLFSGGVLIFINSYIGLSIIQVGVPLAIICLGVAVLWNEGKVRR